MSGSVISVATYGVIGNGIADDTAALAAARSALDALAALGAPATLVFPPGIYKYSVSPNWAIANARIVAQGEVRLRYTGVGNAVILDGGATGAGVYNTTFGRFIVEAPGTALNAVYCRALHHSGVFAKVLGAGAAYAGLRTEWCVLTDFRVVVSVNEEGWYGTNRPYDGIYLAARGAGEYTSYCNFSGAAAEGVANIGIYLSGTLGNNFFGGAAEGCGLYGLYGGGSHGDKLWGVDFESNTVADIYLMGSLDTALLECDSAGLTSISTNAKRVRVVGGNYSQLTIDGNANSTLIDGVKYNRLNNGCTLTDAGVNTRITNALNVGTGAWHA